MHLFTRLKPLEDFSTFINNENLQNFEGNDHSLVPGSLEEFLIPQKSPNVVG